MFLRVVGSSSKGNCYILGNEKSSLIIECGVPFSQIKNALNYNLRTVAGCLLTHEHTDHSLSVADVVGNGIKVFSSQGTKTAIGIPYIVAMQPREVFMIGDFKVFGFNVKHDAAEPFGFVIYHEECGSVLFLTDTGFLKNRFSFFNNIIIECNHDTLKLSKKINSGEMAFSVAQRIKDNHLSYEECIEMLNRADITKVNNIVLAHLSSSNSDPEKFKRMIESWIGKSVTIARTGVEIDFGKTDF